MLDNDIYWKKAINNVEGADKMETLTLEIAEEKNKYTVVYQMRKIVV